MKRLSALLLALVTLFTVLSFSGCGLFEKNDDDSSKSYRVLKTCTELDMLRYRAIYEETGYNPIVDEGEKVTDEETQNTYYKNVTVNYYYAAGFGKYLIITEEEYLDIQRYQNETGRRVIYPTVKYSERTEMQEQNKYNADIYYQVEKPRASSIRPKLDKDGNFILNYWTYEASETPTLAATYNSIRVEGENGFTGDNGKQYFYAYGRMVQVGVEVRVLRCEYYLYLQEVHPESLPDKELFFELYKYELP